MSAPYAGGNCAIRYPVDASVSSDRLRECARCTICGHRGATIQHPGWHSNSIGFEPFPVAGHP